MTWFSALYEILAPAFEPIMAPLRRQQAPRAQGRTLVVGAGTGLDVPPLLAVGIVPDLLEPDPALARALGRRYPQCRVLPEEAEHISAADASYDTVWSSLVLCSVRDVEAVLHEIHRVLVPGGRFLVTEHVGHRGGWRRAVQAGVDPLWRPLAGGCHLTRRPQDLAPAAGFQPVTCTLVRRGLLLPIIQAEWETIPAPTAKG